MNKIKDSIIDRMLNEGITGTQIDFFIVISRYQDDHNCSRMVSYRDICEEAHIANPTFYTCMRELEEKGYIKYKQNKEHGDWDIQILNNDFSTQESFKDGYLDTNHEIFFDENFFKMTAIEKLLTIKVMRTCQASKDLKGIYRISLKEFYGQYPERFKAYAKNEKLTKRVLQDCLKTLRKFFYIWIKGGMYYFNPRKDKVYQKESLNRRTEERNFREFIGKSICRRLKLRYEETDQEFKDTTDLIKQYKKICKQKNLNIVDLLFSGIKQSIDKANEDRKKTDPWKRELQPKLINKLIHSEIYAY